MTATVRTSFCQPAGLLIEQPLEAQGPNHAWFLRFVASAVARLCRACLPAKVVPLGVHSPHRDSPDQGSSSLPPPASFVLDRRRKTTVQLLLLEIINHFRVNDITFRLPVVSG